MMAAANLGPPKPAESLVNPRESGTQLRPGLWHTINERYPGSMITKSDFIPLARPAKPLGECRVCLISSCGVHLKSERPMDVAHPLGDFTFRRVPSHARQGRSDHPSAQVSARRCRLGHQRRLPIKRLQELAGEGVIGGITRNFFSFIGYNMDADKFEVSVVEGIARAVGEEERPHICLLAPA